MTIRFLVMNAFTVGGTVRTTFTTAEHLARRHDVEIVSVYRRRDEPALELPPGVKLRCLTDLRSGARRPPWQRWALSEPSRLVSRHDYRYDNFSGLTDANLLRFLLSVRDGALIGTRPGLNLAIALLASPSVTRVGQDHVHLRVYKAKLRAQMRAHYPRLDAVTALTEETAIAYRELLGPEALVECIPNGVPRFDGRPPALDAKVVVAAGRLVRQKGFDRLLAAWAKVADRHPEWQLKIFGSGDQREDLQTKIDQLGIADSAHLAGFTPNLQDEFASASLYVMSSRNEGFPMVLLEAMTVGLPVISFDCPTGPGDVISEGVSGHLVANGDVEALAARMSELMSEPARRRAYGAAAREAATPYEPARLTARLEALLTQLAVVRTERRPPVASRLTLLGGLGARRAVRRVRTAMA